MKEETAGNKMSNNDGSIYQDHLLDEQVGVLLGGSACRQVTRVYRDKPESLIAIE